MTDRCTAILVDGSNNYASLKALGYQMDFDKLLKLDYFGEVYRPYYFTALPPKEEHSALRPMVDHLQYHGWTVITKETKTWDNGADGIKTGYVRASGFNIVTSVNDNGRKLVAVVMGGDTARARDQQVVDLVHSYLPMAASR